MSEDLDAALALVKSAGYVVLKEKSYRQAQERQRVAEALKDAAERDAERTAAWAREVCAEERRIRDRLTFVYGVAKAHGATDADLSGCEQCSRATCFCGNPGAPEVVHRAHECVPWRSRVNG